MDRLGHLNQSSYHDLFYEARSALLEPIRSDTSRFVIAHAEIDYVHEVCYADGHVDIDVWVATIGSKSVTLEHEMRLPNGMLAARDVVVLVAWDVTRRCSRLLRSDERRQLGAV
jgi:acyl-CoA thioesterase FadM